MDKKIKSPFSTFIRFLSLNIFLCKRFEKQRIYKVFKSSYTKSCSASNFFYSDSLSSLMVSFYKTNLSFRLDPFISKDATGLSSYDYKNGLTTTVSYEGAAALYIVANMIVHGEVESNGMILTIPCASGAALTLERRPFSVNGQCEQMEALLCITKNNVTIPFKFEKHQVQIKENGQMVTKFIESGLGAFAMTVKGYLTGIGADRHLNKLPEDFDDLESQSKQLTNGACSNSSQISYITY